MVNINMSEALGPERQRSDDVTEGLAEQAFSRLHGAILSGELEPGAPVTEVELVEVFEITRAPVRTAISRLVHEGWLVQQSRRRIIVRPITLRDVREVFDLRKLIEPEVARRAAGRVDARKLQELDEQVGAAYDPADKAAETRFFQANARLHILIAEAAGNQRTARLVEKLHDESQRILRVGMRHTDWSRGWQHGHCDLIDALASGDGERAAEIALRQLVSSERVVMDALTDMFDAIGLGEIRH